MNRPLDPDRRALLLAAASVATLTWLGACGSGGEPAKPGADPTLPMGQSALPVLVNVGEEETEVLRAMLDRILPRHKGLPSARDAGVEVYLDRELGKPQFKGIKAEIGRGLVLLDQIAQHNHQGRFHTLTPAQQDAILRSMQDGTAVTGRFQGPRFFEMLHTLSLEGYLGHPRYGGNRDEVAWKALGIDWHHG